MSRDDILFYLAVIGGPATIVSCLYQILAYHWPSGGVPMASGTSTSWLSGAKAIWVNALLALLVCGALATDYYDRRESQSPSEAAFISWGAASQTPNAPPLYTGIVDAPRLEKYKDDYKVILLARNASTANVDPQSDTAIERSTAYTIDGPVLQMSFTGSGKLKFGAGQGNMVAFYAVLIPNAVSPDEITRLADIARVNGKTVAQAGQIVVGAMPPSASSAQATHP